MDLGTEKLRKLSHHELSVFCAQIAMLIKGGLAPYESVNVLLSDTKDREGKLILTRMMEVINTGEKLHVAMEKTGVFPDYVIHMITIGEETGRLDTVLDALSAYYEREDSLRETIRSALSYPLMMIAIMFIIILVLLTRVLPIFAQVFAQLGTGMNAFSSSLLAFGTHINRYLLAVVVVLALIAAFVVYLMRTEHGRRLFSAFTERFPLTRSLHRDIAAGRFANGMSLTLSSGMDTYQSLDLVGRIVENKAVAEKIEKAKALIREQGLTFPEALSAIEIFSGLYTRMILVGFKSGSMDASMRQIALQYEKDTDRRIYGVISVVEPTLIILLSVIVGIILLSVIMPLMGVMSSIG